LRPRPLCPRKPLTLVVGGDQRWNLPLGRFRPLLRGTLGWVSVLAQAAMRSAMMMAAIDLEGY
jgi:hypothetical protein